MKEFKRIIMTLIVIYLILYTVNITGYYEYSNYNKTTLTNEQIQKFEQDIKDGNNIDINDYVIKNITYSNKLSNTNLSIGKTINKIFAKMFTKTLDFLNQMIE